MRVIFIMISLLLATEAGAEDTARATVAAQSQAQEQADVSRVEDYLNGLATAQADFTFVAPDGAVSRGEFYLSRPSKLRFEYTEPTGNLLIADGDYVIFWDSGQKQASNLPIGDTPLAFLLKPKISLTDGLRILAYEHSAGITRFQLARSKDSSDGAVTVAFSDQPMALQGWRLVDAQNRITEVNFSNWRVGMSLAPSLFHFEGPHPGKSGR